MSNQIPAPNKTIHAGALTEKTAFINVSPSSRLSSAIIASWLLRNSLSHWKDRSSTRHLLQLGAAGYLFYRGLSGNCPVSAMLGDKGRHTHSINIRETFVVQQPKQLVYYAWSQLANLPLFLKHVKSIEVLENGRSHWAIHTPKGLPDIEWEAEIVEDHPGEMFSWRSLPGSSIETAGKVTMRDFPGGATQVRVLISYRPPAGYIGSMLARVFTPAFKRMVKEDIAHFQEYVGHFQSELLL
jgi:uncharacterized membrane protein